MRPFKTTKIISIWANQDDGPSIVGEPDEHVHVTRDLDAASLISEMELAESSDWHFDAESNRTIVNSYSFDRCYDIPNSWQQITLLIDGNIVDKIEEIYI